MNSLSFRAGSFSVSLDTDIRQVVEHVQLLYPNLTLGVDKSQLCDFDIELKRSTGLRRWLSPQANFSYLSSAPFAPLPFAHASPMLEWGMNWCVTQHCHQYLIIHAAVVEKNGIGVVLPGRPGAGKSTLCAALVHMGGWRLLSDELALLETADSELVRSTLVPNPRPISLKNRSIDLMKSLVGAKRFTPVVRDTLKGTVAHLEVPSGSYAAFEQRCAARFVVFPKYLEGGSERITLQTETECFTGLCDQAFNYSVLGVEGFHTLVNLVNAVDCYEYQYDGNVETAIHFFDRLANDHATI